MFQVHLQNVRAQGRIGIEDEASIRGDRRLNRRLASRLNRRWLAAVPSDFPELVGAIHLQITKPGYRSIDWLLKPPYTLDAPISLVFSR